MITDTELVEQFSDLLGDDYASAKSYVRDIPTQALVYVRSFTHKLASVIADKHQLNFTSANLYDRIEQLNQRRLIEVSAIRAMHKLRADGNRGAHPEKYHLTQNQLVTIAEKSIRQIISLVTQLYPAVHGSPVPENKFIEFDSFAGRDLCYRAMMHNDHHAQYLVAMSLKAQALMAQEQVSATQLNSDKPQDTTQAQAEVKRLFAQAAYWFAQAAPYEMAALYEHGVSLLHGYAATDSKEELSAQGEALIAKAADNDVIEAKALLGYFYLVGSQVFEVDLEKAKTLLTQAAETENIEAMSNLGVLYYQTQQHEQALAWMQKAAKSGYPQSQYHLALLLAEADSEFNGIELAATATIPSPTTDLLEQSQYWMQEAASQGQLEAMLHCASQILHDDNATKEQLQLAEHYLYEVIKYGHDVTAMIELSVALADGILGRIDVVQAAYLLQQAKLHATDVQLQVIAPLWQSLLMQIDNVMALSPSEEQLAALAQAKTILS
ncbi:tetratricopeptide repeat protein [Shewanella gaetbuli]